MTVKTALVGRKSRVLHLNLRREFYHRDIHSDFDRLVRSSAVGRGGREIKKEVCIWEFLVSSSVLMEKDKMYELEPCPHACDLNQAS